MKKNIGFGILFGLTVAAGAQAGQLSGQDLVLSGRVQSVNKAAGSITVLGHTVVTRDASQVADGQLVNVYGVIAKDGSIIDAVLESVTNYVPGVDQAYIKGVVTAIDATGSVLAIGNTQVDFTAAAGTAQVGQVVAYSGVQAAASSAIRASKRAGIGAGGESTSGIGAGGDGTSGIGAGGDRSQGIGAGGDGTSGIGAGGESTSGIGAGGDRSQGIGAGGDRSSGIGAGGESTSGIGAGGDRSQGIGAGGDSTSGIGAGGDRSSGIGAGGESTSGIGAGGDRSQGIGAGGDSTSGIGAGGDRSSGIGAGGDHASGIGAGGDSGG